jgi:GNAT superfamily N-acetyltransferase
MPDVDYRPFTSRDWPQIKRFYETAYGSGYVLSERKFFNWNFFSPLRQDSASTLMLAVSGGRIVGSCGALPWRVQIDGDAKWAVYNVNLFLAPAFRGHGIGQRLLASVSEGVAYSLSVGADEASVSMYYRIGATYKRDVDRYLRILNVDALAFLLEDRGTEVSEAIFDGWRKAAGVIRSRPGVRGRRIMPVARFDPTWDEAWERIRVRYGLTTWRDCAFLNWRYVDYPFPLYRCFVSSQAGEATGLLVTRIEDPGVGRVLRVVDLVAETNDDEVGLLAFAEQVARENDCFFLDLAAFGADASTFEDLGYLRLAGGRDSFEWIPFDLNPVRTRRSVIFLASHVASETLPDSVAAGQIYVVKGDGDFDRAN